MELRRGDAVAVWRQGFVARPHAAVADQYRERLVALYGAERGRTVKYAEAFELCEYGRQAPAEELKKMFP